jgi:hypothetical protein
MKVSTRTYLERKAGQLVAKFSAEGYAEHGRLPGMIDLAEYLDVLQLEEKGLLDGDGHRIPVTILALDTSPVRLEAVEAYMERRKIEGPFHAAWTAGNDELKFVVASTEIDGMRALREVYRAATAGRAFADASDLPFGGGFRLVANDDGEPTDEAKRPLK